MTATAETTYEIHPLALLIPAMREGEYEELREDIAANGLREPITLFEGQVLDGRHRYRACGEVGVWPTFNEYEGDAPAAYVISLNVKRRQLSQSQKAMIATDFLPHLREEAKTRQGTRTDLQTTSDSQDSEVRFTRSAKAAADQVGVGHAQVVRANRVKQDDPELAQKVRDGEMTVTAAHALVTGTTSNGRPATSERADGHRWSRQPAELVENVVGMAKGLPLAIGSIDVQAAIASPDAPLSEWDKQLTDAITALVRLRKQIRGANA